MLTIKFSQKDVAMSSFWATAIKRARVGTPPLFGGSHDLAVDYARHDRRRHLSQSAAVAKRCIHAMLITNLVRYCWHKRRYKLNRLQ